MGIGFLATRKVNAKPFDRIPSDHFPPIVRFSTELWAGLVILTYNCLFLAAWGFSFPSEVERTMWHVASIFTAIYGLIGGSFTAYVDHVILPFQVPVQMRAIRSRKMEAPSNRFEAWLDSHLNKIYSKLRAMSGVSDEQQVTIVELSGGRPDARRQSLQTRIEPQSETKGRRSKRKLDEILEQLRNNSPDQDPAMYIPLKVWIPTTLLCAIYAISRLYVLIEDVIGLRQLPESAFETVKWASFLPHI